VLQRGITFAGVEFRYPGHEQQVLAGIDLHIPAGSVLALVGDNGAGKTTMAKLLSRFYEPTGGEILVDGVPLAAIEPAVWQAGCTACYQDFARLELLVRQSVGVGDSAAIDDDARLRRAIDDAGAAQLDPSLDRGLDSQLGRRWNGVELSLGQWQRVALARSNLPLAPLLVLLDEPSASLDPETEYDLFERTARAARAATNGAVTVLISHRLTTIQMADHIALLEDGRIVEHGTHDDLIDAGGRYAALYALSAAGYHDEG
jgi:ABC-type multidrug transport system fused ATPase/permease subunit